MPFRDPSKFDHDHDGRAGGSLKHMTKTTDPIEKGKDAPENRFSDGSNQGANKPGGDAMVTTPPELVSKTPPVTEPVTRGAITTSAGNDGRTAGEMAADENAAKAAEIGAAVLHDPETGKPVDVHEDIEGKTGKLVSRDERHDSLDPHTGSLTEEALAVRAERGISAGGLQVEDGNKE